MAWLHATPKPAEGTKRAKILADRPAASRIEKMKKEGITPMMPPNPAPHIVDWLFQVGPTEAAGMGTVAISWQAIDAWCARTCVDLDPWEARMLRRLSAEYVAEARRAEAETCPPPWHQRVTEQEMAAEKAGLEMVLG